MQPPTVNTAGLTFVDANGNTRKRMIEMIRSCKTGNLEEPFRNLHSVIEEFNAGPGALRGDDSPAPGMSRDLRDARHALQGDGNSHRRERGDALCRVGRSGAGPKLPRVAVSWSFVICPLSFVRFADG